MVDDDSKIGAKFSDRVLKMGKHGPCLHCGIHSTPLWRNGPPEKPVLCNACGSRYRSGKPLENYRPKAHNIGPKKKQKAVVESSSNSSSGYYASSESSPSHNPNCVTVKQEIPDINPVENWRSSWRIHSRKRSRVVYRGLTTIQKLQRDLHNILRDEFNGSEPGGAEDVLIYNVNTNKLQIPPTEIGLGAVLLKFPLPSPDRQNQQQTRVSPPTQAPTASS